MTAMSTTPPDRTTCTTDSGAIEMAATCSSQPVPPTPMPIANHFEVRRPFAVRSGCLMSTVGPRGSRGA